MKSCTNGVMFDAQKFPLFSSVTGYNTLLRSGDCLYIPAFFWHQVNSTQMTISLNIFWGNHNFLEKLVRNKAVKTSFEHWVLNIIEQNHPFSSFKRILANLEEQLVLFLYDQWKETISSEFAKQLTLLIVEHLKPSLGNNFEKSLPSKDKKYSQRLRIRGLMHRAGKRPILKH